MSDPRLSTDSAASHRPTKDVQASSSWYFTVFFLPIAVAALLYQLEPFAPVHFPAGVLRWETLTVPATNDHMLRGSEVVGKGQVAGPEDLVYDAGSGVMYTGCVDGWIKRVMVRESAADSVVENWVNTGGRPLGLALGSNGEVIVADSDKKRQLGFWATGVGSQLEVTSYKPTLTNDHLIFKTIHSTQFIQSIISKVPLWFTRIIDLYTTYTYTSILKVLQMHSQDITIHSDMTHNTCKLHSVSTAKTKFKSEIFNSATYLL